MYIFFVVVVILLLHFIILYIIFASYKDNFSNHLKHLIMKTTSPRYSMFKYVSKSSLKLDSIRYSFVSAFIKSFNKRLNERSKYSNPFPLYFVFYSSLTDISSISDYCVQPGLFPRQSVSVVVSSISEFVDFIHNYSKIRLQHYGDLVVRFDFNSILHDIYSNQF